MVTWLEEQMERAGIRSFAALDAALGKRSTAHRWAAGQRPRWNVMAALAQALNVSVEELILGTWGERVGESCGCGCGGEKALPRMPGARVLATRRQCSTADCPDVVTYDGNKRHSSMCRICTSRQRMEERHQEIQRKGAVIRKRSGVEAERAWLRAARPGHKFTPEERARRSSARESPTPEHRLALSRSQLLRKFCAACPPRHKYGAGAPIHNGVPGGHKYEPRLHGSRRWGICRVCGTICHDESPRRPGSIVEFHRRCLNPSRKAAAESGQLPARPAGRRYSAAELSDMYEMVVSHRIARETIASLAERFCLDEKTVEYRIRRFLELLPPEEVASKWLARRAKALRGQ